MIIEFLYPLILQAEEARRCVLCHKRSVRMTASGRLRKFIVISVTQHAAVNLATSAPLDAEIFITAHLFGKSHHCVPILLFRIELCYTGKMLATHSCYYN
jgi:hypothetical protein